MGQEETEEKEKVIPLCVLFGHFSLAFKSQGAACHAVVVTDTFAILWSLVL